MKANGMIAFAFPPPQTQQPTMRWFSKNGCVVIYDDCCRVYLGGNLIGQYDHGDRTTRNVVVLCIAEEARIRRGRLAEAFGISTELLRQLRLQYHEEGLQAVVNRRRPGAERKMTDALRTRVEAMFDDGITIVEAHAALRRSRKKVSLSVVGEVHRDWKLRSPAKNSDVNARDGNGVDEESPQSELGFPNADDGDSCVEHSAGESLETELPSGAEQCEPETPNTGVSAGFLATGDVPVLAEAPRTLRPVALKSTRHVQHLGVWLLFALLESWGIYDSAEKAAGGVVRLKTSVIRIALDALIAALAIGQRCVEGVRRLMTPSAGVLLRTTRCPSAPWVRGVFGRVARDGCAARLHVDVALHFISEAQACSDSERPVVFYVDNHLRPYTGKQTIRKGWRMQDRRARPGVTDYYMHDEAGNPVLRIDVPEHGHLTHWLPPLAELLRDALGPDERILVAFDRGGSFAEHLTKLRDMKVEFVTYERKPYRRYSRSLFDHEFVDGKERILVHDTRANLGKGRGRVRRVALLMEDGMQVNLLAVSKLKPEDLYRVARGRWRQENGFKHGNERWGQNQLDGRTTEPVPPDMVIPNPARTSLDRAIRISRAKEGKLRCDLARPDLKSTKREKLEYELSEVVRKREDLESTRPWIPKHAPLEETPLAGKLVRHPGEYKLFVDSVRIACANAESELAALVAPQLARPAEAKKVISNLFSAAGDVTVRKNGISVLLKPAGTSDEKRAMKELLRKVSRMKLSLPGDKNRRPVSFRTQE